MSKIPTKMPIVSLPETARQLGESGARVND